MVDCNHILSNLSFAITLPFVRNLCPWYSVVSINQSVECVSASLHTDHSQSHYYSLQTDVLDTASSASFNQSNIFRLSLKHVWHYLFPWFSIPKRRYYAATRHENGKAFDNITPNSEQATTPPGVVCSDHSHTSKTSVLQFMPKKFAKTEK